MCMWQSQAFAGALSSGRSMPDEYGTCSSARATPPRRVPPPRQPSPPRRAAPGAARSSSTSLFRHLPVLAPQARAERSGQTRRSCSSWAPGVNRAVTGDPHPSGIRLGPEVERDPRGRHGGLPRCPRWSMRRPAGDRRVPDARSGPILRPCLARGCRGVRGAGASCASKREVGSERRPRAERQRTELGRAAGARPGIVARARRLHRRPDVRERLHRRHDGQGRGTPGGAVLPHLILRSG